MLTCFGLVICGFNSGHQEGDMYTKDWNMCLKFGNHSRFNSQHNRWGGGGGGTCMII